MLKRIHFLNGLYFILILSSCQKKEEQALNLPIDRHALVTQHNPTNKKVNPLSPFSVGNGNFAFTVDVTGLQTLSDSYETGIPLCTESNWCWHSLPNSNNYCLDSTFVEKDTDVRLVPYAANQNSPAGQWLRANPHRLHMGRLGLLIDNKRLKDDQITSIQQELDLWKGILKSRFRVNDVFMKVQTACHPDQDQIGIRMESDLLKTGTVSIEMNFPYGSTAWGKNAADWNSPSNHQSELLEVSNHSALIRRRLDETLYYVFVQWHGNAQMRQSNLHDFQLNIINNNTFEFTVYWTEEKIKTSEVTVDSLFNASATHWQQFWQQGAAVDMSLCKDKRAKELERRIILSRYLTAIQCAGSLPPQETGLTCNSWYGKFHLEMHWWHAVHFALWNQPELLEKSMDWYLNTGLPMAQQKAKRQGYTGARWPKMVGPEGRESPSSIGVYLIWQQVHPIYYAELLYRINPTQETLERYQNLVFETAKFMDSFVQWNRKEQHYMLGPPLIPAQEIYQPDSTYNPSFELAYWRWGLETAQLWRLRLQKDPNGKWGHILQHLPPLPTNKGLYQNAGNALTTFDDVKQRNDHPTLLAPYGMLRSTAADKNTMRRTLRKVMSSWNWENTWGWDYPMIAMTAARVGLPDIAIDALMMKAEKNTYLNNGHNFQTNDLPVYLPGNGGLLTAVAMMAGGWAGAPDTLAPGFPKNGKWTIKAEGFTPLP